MRKEKIQILIDKDIPFIKGVLEPFACVSYKSGSLIQNDDITDTHVLIVRTRTFCNRALLDGSSVRLILTATIGTDHIDLNYCSENNIEVVNAKGCNAGSVVQYYLNALRQYIITSGKKLTDVTLGIVGVGTIGSKVKYISELLGMKVLCCDPPREKTDKSADNYYSMDCLREQSDLISLHVPLTRSGKHKTYHLIDALFFAGMTKPIALINTSRGEVVDNNCLNDACNNKKLTFVALDVWENEPDIYRDLLSKVDIATPHIAGYSVDGKAMAAAICVQYIARLYDFPLSNWLPENLPDTKNPTLTIDSNTLEQNDEIPLSFIAQTYDILHDDSLLRANPDKFEELRSNYSIRREPGYYTVRLNAEYQIYAQQIAALGFKLEKV